ncbi:MAG TPA: carboxypeptidase-like regulatory domain-containing protein, partial [Bacteroidales bacterium]|nr:carboxypeptidase-like regulatory domain-containing protein [Bacteroidales bacterium]
MNRFLLFILFVFALVMNVFASDDFTQTVRGRVVDAKTEMPLPGATVFFPGSDPIIGTITDMDGNFRFASVPAGRITLRVSFVGYNPVQLQNLVHTTGKELVLEIGLEETVMQIEGVEIKAKVRK